MDKEIIRELTLIYGQIKALNNRKAELSADLLDEMIVGEVNQLRTPVGVFSLVKKRVYEYPAWFVQQREEMKIAEKKAKKESTYQVSPHVIFTASKGALTVLPEEFEIETVQEGDEGTEAVPVEKGSSRIH